MFNDITPDWKERKQLLSIYWGSVKRPIAKSMPVPGHMADNDGLTMAHMTYVRFCLLI